MKNQTILLALCVASALTITAGCQTEEAGKAEAISWLQSQGMSQGEATILANNKPALRRYLLDKSLAGQDDAYCRSLGAQPGTAVYVNCRTSVSASRPVNDPPKIINQTTNVVHKAPEMPQQQPWPSQQQRQQDPYVPGSALIGAGGDLYCARMGGVC